MSAIWVSVSVCVVAAIVAAGLGVVCALAALRGPGRTLVAVPAMMLMAASTVDMVLPGTPGLHPLAWVALMVAAALLALLDRRRRVAAAHHATALLLMAVMWVAMLPAATGTGAGTVASVTASGPAGLVAAGSPASEGVLHGVVHSAVHAAAHGGHGLALSGAGGLLLGGLAAAASVALAVSAVRSARRAAGSRGIAVADRLEAAQHVSMALAMTMMAGGMLLPLFGT
ncbi:hypothetical protein [Cryobacterium sp. TMT2-23]|uniref:hypothetical protein n=1 Tax=Cryobacterium sp. TMT2-23 TaxID=1259252 RepID=UPI00106C8650|nr:hypothetical protein [Cryobacterium sp. TMT2-23]TFD26383.1 hypothetical protein E3T32_02810 [Cryobacterium sp. TMT2-23]